MPVTRTVVEIFGFALVYFPHSMFVGCAKSISSPMLECVVRVDCCERYLINSATSSSLIVKFKCARPTVKLIILAQLSRNALARDAQVMALEISDNLL